MSGKVLVTPPASEIMTLSEAKLFLKDPPTADDALVTALIVAARKRGEERQDRAYITQTWDYFLDAFPLQAEAIELPRPPLQSVTHIKYTKSDGTLLTVAGTDYEVDTSTVPGRVIPKVDKTWPTEVLKRINGVEIRYVAGYGAAASAVPEHTVVALKQLVSHWYFNRDAMPEIPPGIDAQLLEGYARSYA